MSASPQQRLDAIAEEIRGHMPCGFEICEQATHLVPGEGAAYALVVFAIGFSRHVARPRTAAGGRSSATPGGC